MSTSGVKSSPWDGMLKYYRPSPRMCESGRRFVKPRQTDPSEEWTRRAAGGGGGDDGGGGGGGATESRLASPRLSSPRLSSLLGRIRIMLARRRALISRGMWMKHLL